jgi:hypothetical protein
MLYHHTVVIKEWRDVARCLFRELTASQLVAIATRSDTGSHNRLDLIQSLLPPHYVCNGYLLYVKIKVEIFNDR